METFTKEVMSSPSPRRHVEVSGVKDSGREERVRVPRCQRPRRIQGAAGAPEAMLGS